MSLRHWQAARLSLVVEASWFRPETPLQHAVGGLPVPLVRYGMQGATDDTTCWQVTVACPGLTKTNMAATTTITKAITTPFIFFSVFCTFEFEIDGVLQCLLIDLMLSLIVHVWKFKLWF